MDDPRWRRQEPGLPPPPDDLVAFEHRPRPRWTVPGSRGFTVVVAIVALVTGAGIGSVATIVVRGSGTSPSAVAPIVVTVTPSTPPPSAAPPVIGSGRTVPIRPLRPITTSSASCVAEPTTLAPSEGSTQQYSAHAVFDNRGDLGLTYLVRTTWFLQDAAVASRSVRRDVPPQASEQATITVRVPAGRVLATRAIRDTARCTTMVTLLHTFGSGGH